MSMSIKIGIKIGGVPHVTPAPTWSPEYSAVLASMGTEPSAGDKVVQSAMLDALVAGGYYAKAEFLDVFATHSADSSLINWKSPGTFNPSAVGSPVFTPYKCYTGAVGKYIDLNFIPATHGTLIGADNTCYIIGVQYSVNYEAVFGAGTAAYLHLTRLEPIAATNRRYYYMNANTLAMWTYFTDIKGHFGMSRRQANEILLSFNQTDTVKAVASTGQTTIQLHTLGWLFGTTHQSTTAQVSYVFCFSGMTAVEMKAVAAIMETYLDNYGYGVE